MAQDPALTDTVRLDFPETVELKLVVDYVSATLGLNVIYDENLLNKRVSLRVAEPVPKDALLGILKTILRTRGLALVRAEQAGWLKVIPAERLLSEAGPLQRRLPPATASDEADILTFVLSVRYGDVARINTAITPYLSKPGGSTLVVPESNLLLVTDYARNVQRIIEIAELLDVQPQTMVVETIPVRHQDPAELIATVGLVLNEQARLQAGGTVQTTASLQVDPLSGGIIAIGLPGQIERARELVRRFDVGQKSTTELYQPRYIAVARLRSLIEQMLNAARLKLVADDTSNTLVVTGSSANHKRVRALIERFDLVPSAQTSPMRFYKLMNRRADDVFATLGGLLLTPTAGANSPSLSSSSSRSPTATGGTREAQSNRPAAEPSLLARAGRDGDGQAAERGREALTSIQGENFALSLDQHTNSIIAVAPPELHRQIAQLIANLDKRRPQVLVEVTLISISVDDSLSLGVELEALDLGDPLDFLLFTSFGLSALDPTTGARSLNVMSGGSGILLAPDEVPIIIQALATRGDTRVYSAPRILVDDNATGTIESVAESPFTSVNASNTVATTSFAGFAKAGTQLTIEPHIAEGDHVEIKYSLTVSAFTGAGSGSAPPPRSSNTLSSTIRIPDGHTVIVGGLLTETIAESSSHVPLLGELPLLGWLFGSNTQSKSKVRLYAFIRPTILRHEEFEDLKYISLEDLKQAGVDDGFPPDRWQTMR